MKSFGSIYHGVGTRFALIADMRILRLGIIAALFIATGESARADVQALTEDGLLTIASAREDAVRSFKDRWLAKGLEQSRVVTFDPKPIGMVTQTNHLSHLGTVYVDRNGHISVPFFETSQGKVSLVGFNIVREQMLLAFEDPEMYRSRIQNVSDQVSERAGVASDPKARLSDLVDAQLKNTTVIRGLRATIRAEGNRIGINERRLLEVELEECLRVQNELTARTMLTEEDLDRSRIGRELSRTDVERRAAWNQRLQRNLNHRVRVENIKLAFQANDVRETAKAYEKRGGKEGALKIPAPPTVKIQHVPVASLEQVPFRSGLVEWQSARGADYVLRLPVLPDGRVPSGAYLQAHMGMDLMESNPYGFRKYVQAQVSEPGQILQYARAAESSRVLRSLGVTTEIARRGNEAALRDPELPESLRKDLRAKNNEYTKLAGGDLETKELSFKDRRGETRTGLKSASSHALMHMLEFGGSDPNHVLRKTSRTFVGTEGVGSVLHNGGQVYLATFFSSLIIDMYGGENVLHPIDLISRAYMYLDPMMVGGAAEYTAAAGIVESKGLDEKAARGLSQMLRTSRSGEAFKSLTLQVRPTVAASIVAAANYIFMSSVEGMNFIRSPEFRDMRHDERVDRLADIFIGDRIVLAALHASVFSATQFLVQGGLRLLGLELSGVAGGVMGVITFTASLILVEWANHQWKSAKDGLDQRKLTYLEEDLAERIYHADSEPEAFLEKFEEWKQVSLRHLAYISSESTEALSAHAREARAIEERARAKYSGHVGAVALVHQVQLGHELSEEDYQDVAAMHLDLWGKDRAQQSASARNLYTEEELWDQKRDRLTSSYSFDSTVARIEHIRMEQEYREAYGIEAVDGWEDEAQILAIISALEEDEKNSALDVHESKAAEKVYPQLVDRLPDVLEELESQRAFLSRDVAMQASLHGDKSIEAVVRDYMGILDGQITFYQNLLALAEQSSI